MTFFTSPCRGNVGSLAACLLLLLGQCSAQFHDTHGAKRMIAALTAEATDKRRASNLANAALNPLTTELNQAANNELRAIYKERGSLNYADGTPIPGNENVGSSPRDPRVPVGFNDPLWLKRRAVENAKISTSPHEDEALEASAAAEETVNSGWTYVTGWGATQYHSNMREDEMQTLLADAPNKILRRTCNGCNATHVEIYYKRLTDVPETMLDIVKSNWLQASGNSLGVDFNLYSTYEDARNGVDAWGYCDYPEGTGFPGNCGPTGMVEDQWNQYEGRLGQADVAFFVEDDGATDDVRALSDVEVTRESWLRSDPEAYLQEGGCYGLYKLDDRRACYRACQYMLYKFDEGTAKLCRRLMREGAGQGGYLLAAMREFEGDGTETGSKVKPTHMLGNEDGLPNLGTF